jgi:hypothetical protein
MSRRVCREPAAAADPELVLDPVRVLGSAAFLMLTGALLFQEWTLYGVVPEVFVGLLTLGLPSPAQHRQRERLTPALPSHERPVGPR